MDKYFKKLEEIVLKEKFTIRPNHLTSLFNLHIKQSQFLLESFADQHKNDLIVKYGLLGHQGEATDEIGARRYMIVEQDDVENEKKNFSRLTSCTIKSVKEKTNALDIDYPDELVVTCEEDLINCQEKGFCVNHNVALRKDKLNELLKRLGISGKSLKLNGSLSTPNSAKVKSTDSSTVSQQSKSAVKVIKPEIRSKDLFASFKQKTKQEITPKEEVRMEEEVKMKEEAKMKEEVTKTFKEETNDKADEEFVKLKKPTKKKDKKLKRVIREEDSSEDDKDDTEMFDEEEQVHKSQTSKQVKRSKTFDSDDSDEGFGHSKENFKHKNKKQRKRVVDFDDSSEESNDHKNGIIESKTIIKQKETVSSKLVEEEETYVDEDGFKVHRTIKKVVKDEKNDEPVVKIENIRKETNASVQNKKPVTKPNKPAAKKNQTSIMNFFKPKNQS